MLRFEHGVNFDGSTIDISIMRGFFSNIGIEKNIYDHEDDFF